MKNIICIIVFFIVFSISLGIFYNLDFFKFYDSFDNKTTDWGKLIGYALLPAFGSMVLAWVICKLTMKKRSKSYSKFLFDGDDNYTNMDNSTRNWSIGNYSCGM